MIRYLLRRLLQTIPVLIGTTLLVYYMVFALPGDPIAALFRDKQPPQSVIDDLRNQYHLDEPFWIQYGAFLVNLLTLNLGNDFTQQPVASTLARIFPVTAMLAVEALIIQAVFGVTFGLIAGLRRGRVFDSTVLVVSLIVIAIPTFVLGFVFQLVFGVRLGWAKPTVGANADWAALVLPATVLGLASFAYVLRLTRASVIENKKADYVLTASAKGLSGPRLVLTHILRNSMIPVVTYLGANLGSLMGGAVVIEGIFNVPGVGNKLYQAVLRGEGPTVVIIVSVLVLVFVVANLLVDLLYAWLDPRIRYDK
ncbi:ABC transporter permease [Arthrobacter sp. ISL-28]|uniref:ABC transporter permease n=1 Tax=Arthrobacter sp. ISL-28 TaxID=2819108 RepID=UPI001BE915BB|nr:ABC transporter permease [Arthrobacter sp. ISL-28]MBT2520039.1 ABC transporter permease [Arthrobacter sp. ISL-28]